ncbi:MAG: hypothetical protein ACKO2C_01585 [Actinomycetes bacterium]
MSSSVVRSARDTVTAVGLAAILDRYRNPVDPEAPVVALPDLDGVTDRIESAATSALLAADRALSIVDSVHFDEDLDHEAFERAAGECAEWSEAVRSDAIALATVLLGVTSQWPASDAVHFTEHAVTSTLAELADGQRLGEGTPALVSRTRAELVTEIGGLICRLLAEDPHRWDPSFVQLIVSQDRWVYVEGSAAGITVGFQATDLEPDAGTTAVLEHIGWPSGSWEPADEPGRALGLCAAVRLEDDLYVGEIAAFIVGTLFDLLGVTDPSDLQISAHLDDAGATAAPRLIARGGRDYDSPAAS